MTTSRYTVFLKLLDLWYSAELMIIEELAVGGRSAETMEWLDKKKAELIKTYEDSAGV